jgi:hypothetical protein
MGHPSFYCKILINKCLNTSQEFLSIATNVRQQAIPAIENFDLGKKNKIHHYS